MRRGKEEKERGLDTADTRYFDEKAAAGDTDAELTTEELKKKEKKSFVDKIKGVFKSEKSPAEKIKELEKETKKLEKENEPGK